MPITIITGAGRRNRTTNARRWASAMARGKTGGAFGMQLFDLVAEPYSNLTQSAINAFHNARDPGELPYLINPNLWCLEILDQLSCYVIHTDTGGTGFANAPGLSWRARYGAMAITKRHVVSTGHAFEHAAGTWSAFPGQTVPTRRRFRGMNGETVDRVQIHQEGRSDLVPGAFADLCVGVLDADLPDSIYIPRVAPSNRLNELAGYQRITLSQEWQPASGTMFNLLGISQVGYTAKAPGHFGDGISVAHVITGTGSSVSVSVSGLAITVTFGSATTNQQVRNAVNAHAPAAALVGASVVYNEWLNNLASAGSRGPVTAPLPLIADYPLLNRQMFHIFHDTTSAWYAVGEYWRDQSNVLGVPPGFAYGAYSGDSGTVSLTRLNNEMVFSNIVSGASSISRSPDNVTWPQLLNAYIAQADANAIAMGRLAAPTGYTVTPYTGPIL